MATTSRNDSPDHTVLNETRAKQGRWGRPVVWVLLISTILAAAGMFAAWGFKADDMAATEPFSSGDAQDAKMFNAPEPAPVIPQPEQVQPATSRP